MNKELKIEGVFYISMLSDESEEHAIERFKTLITDSGISANEDCYSFEVQEL